MDLFIADNTGMIQLLLSSPYTVSRPFLLFTPLHWCLFTGITTCKGPGVHKESGGDRDGTADPNCPKGYSIPYSIMLRIQVGGKRRKQGAFYVMVFVFPSPCYVWWRPAFVETAKHLVAHGKQEINSLFDFACVCCFCFFFFFKRSLYEH